MKTIDLPEVFVRIAPRFGKNSDVELQEFPKKTFSMRAKIAVEMVSKWGPVAASNDGEDSAGRARIVTKSPSEVVAHAVETADLLVSEFERLGWLFDGLHPDEATLDENA